MKCLDTKSNQSSNNNNNTKRFRRRSSANWICTSPVGAVTSLIHLFGNQIILFGTRVARSRRHGARALILGRNLRNVPNSIILIASISILGIINICNNTYATDSTLSLSIDNSTVSMDIAATNVNGTFSKSSASTISASTNNATGYTLSVSAPSNAGSDYNKLINGSDNTAKLSSISSATTEAQFKALNGTAYNGMWGYLPSRYCSDNKDGTTCADNTDFLPAPTTTGDTIDITNTANTTANNYTLAIGARIDDTVKVGAYTNTFIVKLVGNAIPYTVTYIDPTVSNMPVDEDTTSATETPSLSSNIPKKSGYIFGGWCTEEPTTAGITTTCNGTTYVAGATHTIDKTSLTNDLTLYAIWKRNTMQNVAEWQDSIGIGEETTAVDTRDGKVYSVARLCMSAATHTTPALNTCDRSMLWMTQNLDLSVGPTGSQVLTSADSDINQDLGTAQGYNTDGATITWTPNADTMNAPKYITNHATGNPANSTNWVNDNNLPYWAEGGDYYVYTSGNNGTDSIYGTLTACITAGHTEEQCRHYHVGNYYNWSAAVATNASSSYTDDLYVMPNSICPKGWRLPNGLTGTNGNEIISEFNQLALANNITAGITTAHTPGSGSWVDTGWTSTGFNSFRSTSANSAGKAAPMYFTRSGHLDGTTLYRYGTSGFLWSSTSQSTSVAYYLDFSSGAFYPATQYVRYLGFPVRCVAR